MVSAGAELAEGPSGDAEGAEAEKGAEQPSEPLGGLAFDLSVEVDSVTVCGLDLRVLKRRGDFFRACAGDLPMRSTGVVLWECGVLLADYLGYARWVQSGSTDGAAGEEGEDPTGDDTASIADGDDRSDGDERPEAPRSGREARSHPWWMTHPPAPVVPSRFWTDQPLRVLELGGGCGLVTAVLASLGARVVCSDCDPEALRTAKRNCCEAKNRYGCGAHSTWGSADFRELRWGDEVAARKLVQECGPFGFIVGSDLLYGDISPPEPLIETLAAFASEPNARGAEVVLAAKSRCANEAERFCRLAEARGLWSIHLGKQSDFMEGYEEMFKLTDSGASVPAYNVIHLRPLPAAAEAGAPAVEPDSKRQKL